MTYYDLNMNSKKLTATTGVERDTSVAGTSVQQIYKQTNSSPANCATELRMASGSQTNTGTVDLFVNPDASQQLAGYYSYQATTPGLFMKSITPDGGSTEYCSFTDNALPQYNELPENHIRMRNSSSYTQNFIQLRTAFDIVNTQSYLYLGYDNFTLQILNNNIFTVNNTSNDLFTYRNINFGTNTSGGQVGIIAKSSINATTTGSTTLTTSQAFQTIINTPSAVGRIFVLPAPSTLLIGYWWEVCNKSASQSITINSSGGVALATITATTAGGAGNVARIGIDSAGTGYFRTQ